MHCNEFHNKIKTKQIGTNSDVNIFISTNILNVNDRFMQIRYQVN